MIHAWCQLWVPLGGWERTRSGPIAARGCDAGAMLVPDKEGIGMLRPFPGFTTYPAHGYSLFGIAYREQDFQQRLDAVIAP